MAATVPVGLRSHPVLKPSNGLLITSEKQSNGGSTVDDEQNAYVAYGEPTSPHDPERAGDVRLDLSSRPPDHQDLDDLVLKLMEQCQVESNSKPIAPDAVHAIAVSVKEANAHDDTDAACACANANAKPRKAHRQDIAQNAISITNFDIPGCMANASKVKRANKGHPPKALKVVGKRKVIAGANTTTGRGRHAEAPTGGSSKLRYYDFSARSLCEMREPRDRDSTANPDRNSADKDGETLDPVRHPKAETEVGSKRFDLRRLLRLFDKGSVPDSAWETYRVSTRRGQLQDGKIHRSPKDSDQPAYNRNNNSNNNNRTNTVNRMLLSVTGSRYQELSAKDRFTVLSSYYQTKSRRENRWRSGARGRNLSRTPGELAILMGRAMNKKEVGFYRKRRLSAEHDCDSDTSGAFPDLRSFGSTATPPRRTCHISVHLPAIQRELSAETRHPEEESGADPPESCLDIEGHFPPTIDRQASRIGKLASGCRARNNARLARMPSEDDVTAGELNIVKLPIISPDGGATSGGLIRNPAASFPTGRRSPMRTQLDDRLPGAPPGTPVSLSSQSLWPAGHGVLDILTSLRRSSIPEDTVTPFSSLAALADVDRSIAEQNRKWDTPKNLGDLKEYSNQDVNPDKYLASSGSAAGADADQMTNLCLCER